MFKAKVLDEMRNVFKEVPYGIEHTLRVLRNAEEIMEEEDVRPDEREQISIVAILHDIGALEAQRKYGSMEAKYQEKEGPMIARRILENLGYDPKGVDRICYIVGNHHTPSKIDGLDFQIQWEADLLDNLAYMQKKPSSQEFIDENFKTKAGRRMAYSLLRQ